MSLTDAQSREAQRREHLCLCAKAMMKQGASLNDCARRLNEPIANLHRYLKKFDQGGFEKLVPRQAGRSGAKTALTKLVEGAGAEAVGEFLKSAQALALDTESTGLALRSQARQEGTPEPIKSYFAQPRRSKHNIAPSIKRAVHTGELLLSRHRGPRRYLLDGPWQPRELDILPGDIFTSDDTTPIWGWWVPWPKCPKYPHSAKLLQGQFLPVADVASQLPLCYALIAREQDSYRAADIWRLMGRVHTLVGLPRLGWQKERGSWEAAIIDGVYTETSSHSSASEPYEPTHAQRVGGLRMLPSNLLRYHIDKLGEEKAAQWRTLRTWTSYVPKSKSIEAIFHRLQKFEGTLWGVLGRSQQRRPYEKTKKIFQACKDGRADPRLHFLSATEMVHRLNACIDQHNAESMEGEVFRGKPPETWARGIAEHGPLLEEPADGRWLMTSDWALVKAGRGMVRIRRVDEATGANVSYCYHNPDFCGPLDGRQVLVYFNRDEFETPAHVLVPRAGSGQPLYHGRAEYIERRGMFLDGDLDGFELRKRQSGIVTTIYSDLAPLIPSRQLPGEIAARRAVAVETRMPGGNMAGAETISWGGKGGGVVPGGTRPAAAHPSGGSTAPLDEDEAARRSILAADAGEAALRQSGDLLQL